MAEQGGSFQSLEELRKHWSSRATSKRKQTEQTSSRRQSQTNGESSSHTEHTTSEAHTIVRGGVPAVLDGRFGQAWLPGQRDGNASSEQQTEGSRKGTGASDSEDERAPAGNRGDDSKPRRTGEAGARHPPSLSVMRPLGDYGATIDLPAQPGNNNVATPTGSKQGSSRAPAAKPPAFAGAAAANMWKQRQTTQQLSSGIAGLGKQVMEARGQQEKEQAILKLYAVLCQTAWVSQPGLNEEWTASYLGLLELGLPRFVKHVAALVLRRDKGYSDLVRSMAAAVLKNLMKWMETHVSAGQQDETHTLVVAALESILMDGAPSGRGGARAIRLTGGGDDSMAGYGNLLDTDALEGLLDPEAAPSTRRPARRDSGAAAMETNHMFGSLMDTGSLEALVSQGRPPRRSTGSHLMGTHVLSSFGSALDTSDVAGHMMEHKGALRATIWLFKSDQADAWCAAASLVGSIGMLGAVEIDAMGGPKLVKPLMWVLRNGEAQSKCAAMRALQVLSQDIACRTVMARQDKYLRAMVRILQSTDLVAKNMAVSTLNMLLAHDPSTHWVLARSGIVPALVEVIKQPLGLPAVNADATLGLKHLTSSSQRNREALLHAKGIPHLIRLIREGNTDAQYNAARILRHLAMGGSTSGKAAACQAIPALVHGLQVGRPRVCFACAAALAMVTEGQPSACEAIEAEGGIKALVQLLVKGGGQGKKVAAEALQAMAAESEAMRPKIAAAGCIRPLVQMLHVGNLQQQAAAAGAVQAIAYCPSSPSSLAGALAAQGVVQPLVKILNTAPRAMRCAAAGALCNLALRDPAIQGQIVDAGALEALVDLLSDAQPDGQYSAAAALVNLTAVGQEVRAKIVDAGALPPLLVMLTAESWYCRIVAAELIAQLGSDGGLERAQLADSGTLNSLVSLLCLQHTPGTLEEVGGEVAHLAYERSQDIIVMKGYKFARAKVAAAAALGVVAAQDDEVAAALTREGGVAEELAELLPTGRTHVRLIAAGAIADLARSSPEARNAFLLADAGLKLASLIKLAVSRVTKPGKHTAMSQPPGLADAAAAATALLELVVGDEAASQRAVGDGVVPPLLYLYQHGEKQEALAAASLLRALHQVAPGAKKALKGSGYLEAILAGQESIVGPQGTTAALLQQNMTQQMSGYAITAKPSANLYILLQVPFEALLPPGLPAPNSGGRRSRTGKKKSRRQGESREAGGQGQEPTMASVDETGPALETSMNTLSLADEYEVDAQNYWQPVEPQPGKSRSDILETWADAEPRAAA